MKRLSPSPCPQTLPWLGHTGWLPEVRAGLHEMLRWRPESGLTPPLYLPHRILHVYGKIVVPVRRPRIAAARCHATTWAPCYRTPERMAGRFRQKVAAPVTVYPLRDRLQ